MQSLFKETATRRGESSRTASKRRRVEDFSDDDDSLECHNCSTPCRNCSRLSREREHAARDAKKFFTDNCAFGRAKDPRPKRRTRRRQRRPATPRKTNWHQQSARKHPGTRSRSGSCHLCIEGGSWEG